MTSFNTPICNSLWIGLQPLRIQVLQYNLKPGGSVGCDRQCMASVRLQVGGDIGDSRKQMLHGLFIINIPAVADADVIVELAVEELYKKKRQLGVVFSF